MTYLSECLADSPNALFLCAEAAGQEFLVSTVHGYTAHPLGSPPIVSSGYSGPDSALGAIASAGNRWRSFGPMSIPAAVSVEFWFFHGEWSGSIGPPLAMQIGTAPGSGFATSVQIYRSAGGNPPPDDNSAIVFQPNSGSPLAAVYTPTRTWHHVVATDDASNCILYLDGVSVASRASAGQNSVPLGFDIYDVEYIFFSGVAQYPSTLSSSRILAHFNAADRKATPPGAAGSATLNLILQSVRRTYPPSA